jgi:hypothetical protein
VLKIKTPKTILAMKAPFAVFQIARVVAKIRKVAIIEFYGTHDFVAQFATEVTVRHIDAVPAFNG